MKCLFRVVQPVSMAGWLFLSQFVLGFGAAASDVTTYLVEKGIDFTQTSTGIATPDTNNGYILEASLKCAANTVTSASVQPPGLLPLSLAAQPGNAEFKYRKEYDSLSKLNKHAPSGRYFFSIDTLHDGAQAPSLALQGDLYPATSHFLNFDATQNLDAGAFFDLRWEFLAGGVSPDFVQVRIEDGAGNRVFETPDSGPEALSGADSSLLLTPGVLTANQVYQAAITAANTVAYDTNGYPGAAGAARYYKRLKFAIRTAPVSSLADARTFELLKMELYGQVSTNPPAVLANNGFLFHAQVTASASNGVLSAALAIPPAASTDLAAGSSTRYEYEVKFDSLNQLDSSYPTGSYTFAITGAAQGARNLTLLLPPDQYLPAPRFAASAQAQRIDPAHDFLLQWMPVAGAASSDFIHLQIEDAAGVKVFETADPGKPKALAGTRTSAIIPAYTLSPGTLYTAKLLFIKVTTLDTTSYPGALGIAGFGRETHLEIATAGGTVSPPRLTNPHLGAQGFSFTLNGAPAQSYAIDVSTNLLNWSMVGAATTSAGGETLFTDTNQAPLGARFYRARVP